MYEIKNHLRNILVKKHVIPLESSWYEQTGGQTNKVWRVVGEQDLICKLYQNSQNNPLFKNMPEDEYRCLKWLEGSNIAPKPYKLLETELGMVLLYHYVDGALWSNDLNAVSDLLCRIHEHKILKGLRIISGLPSQIQTSGLKIINNLNNKCKNELTKICPNVIISEIEPVLVHTDVVVGNLIFGNQGLRLIDWQCPALGDPVLDIAMFLSPGMHEIYGSGKLSMKDHEIFLMNLTPKLRSRYNILGPLYHWRLAAYCFWKAEQGFIEYEKAALAEINLLKMI